MVNKKFEYNADLVWTAACFAQRTNGTYIKNVESYKPMKVDTNRQLVEKVLTGTYIEQITDEDREQGKKVREFFQAYTFLILKGQKLSDFDNNAMLCANREIITNSLELGIIAYLPESYEKQTKKANIKNRIVFAQGGFVGTPGDKVTIEIEVLKSIYSNKWNTNYITGITVDDKVVFFPYNKTAPSEGSKIKIQGLVKGFSKENNTTSLNRVKII
jgi:hypothetical protein